MEDHSIIELLNKYFSDYKIINSKNNIVIKKSEIKQLIDYSYNGRKVDSKAILIFTDDLNFKSQATAVICDNPKYKMYDFIFNVLFTHYFRLTDPINIFKENYVITNFCKISSKSTIGYSCSIGQPSFSFYKKNDQLKKVKPIYSVRIDDNVDISNNTTIDAGIFRDTHIQKNCKIDSNVYIAHDVIIGENSIITSGVSIGGFVKIGRNSFIGMNTSIRNNVIIGKNVTIGMGSVVTKNFGDNCIVFGNPAKIVKFIEL